jgi:metallo-beta-lactamase class B
MLADFLAHPWKTKLDPFKIAGNLYFVGNTEAAVYLVETDDGCILFDSGFPQTGYLLLESIRMLGFKPKDIKLILHTHGHYNHVGGTRALVDLAGAKTALGAGDVPIVGSRADLSRCDIYGAEFFEQFVPDTTIVEDSRFVLGKTTVECVPTPGHTQGCVSYFFTVRAGKRKGFVAALHGGASAATVSPEYLALHNLPGSLKDSYLQNFGKLKLRPVDIVLGHHPATDGLLEKKAGMNRVINPFINQHEWQAFLDKHEQAARTLFSAG